MTYLGSAEGVTITKSRAMRELRRHGITHPTDLRQFLADCGDRPTYRAVTVLHWLGY